MLRALAAIGLLQLATMLVQLVRTKTLALVLGPEQVGIMAVIDKLLAVVTQTLSLSMPFAALRFLPARWTESPASFGVLYRRMVRVVTGLALLAAAGVIAVTAIRPAIWGTQLVPYRSTVLTAGFAIPVLALGPFLQNVVAGKLQQNRAMIVGLVLALAATVAVAGIHWWGLAGYYGWYAVLGALVLVATARTITRGIPSVPRGSLRSEGPLGLPHQVWRFSGALLILTFLSPYTALFVHYGILRSRGAESAGWMQAAAGIGLAVRALLGSANSVFLTPNVNRPGRPEERMAWANQYYETFCLLATALLPPVLLFPHLAVQILYSPAFAPGAVFVPIFVVLEIMVLLSGTYSALVVALDHLGVHVVQNVLSQGLVIAVAFALVKPFGILGAGLALLCAPIFLLMSTTAFLHWRHGLRMSRRAAMLSFQLIAVMLGLGVLGTSMPRLSATVFTMKLGLVVLTLLVVALALTPEERLRAQRSVERVLARKAL